MGTGAAWIVTAYDFPGRRVLAWALLLPLAMPTYIIAYAYLDLLHPVGPVQTAMRAVLGIDSPRDFRLPDIRSMPGCILLLSLVLYPYVYIPVRALFLSQAANLLDVARTLGTPRRALFHRVALPLARPAIAVGTSLALMEALNDVGAAEFLGVRTLTVSIYSTWVTRNDLPGAAQIALSMLVVVLGLIVLERWARRRHRYAVSAVRATPFQPLRLRGWQAGTAVALCVVPVALGFAAPAAYLVRAAWVRIGAGHDLSAIAAATAGTLTLAAAATVLTLALGLTVAAASRLRPGAASAVAARAASIGYAMPGTVVALGLLLPVATADRWIDRTALAVLGEGTGLLFLGSGAALVLAYTVRFLAISTGTLEAGFSRLPRSFDIAARSLGRSRGRVLREIHLPLLHAPMAAAALLIFVDCVKELPATLMLRPLGVETLATQLYGEAARGTYENGAVAALLIVAVGMLPAVLLARISGR
nr:iron ABC transporter permease [Paracoccus sp. S-4012]